MHRCMCYTAQSEHFQSKIPPAGLGGKMAVATHRGINLNSRLQKKKTLQ